MTRVEGRKGQIGRRPVLLGAWQNLTEELETVVLELHVSLTSRAFEVEVSG